MYSAQDYYHERYKRYLMCKMKRDFCKALKKFEPIDPEEEPKFKLWKGAEK